MKYIAYCRKSTDEKDKQVLSIEAQIAELKEFATREHLEVVDFITEAKTAKIPGREQFDQLLKRIEKGEASGILAWHPDRLARNSIDSGKIIYFLDIKKLLDLKFPSYKFDNTPEGKFMLSIIFGESKHYVDSLSENVKRGNRQKLRNGVWPSLAPYGYVNNPKTRGIDVDLEKSVVVRQAFELFTQGKHSMADVARFMNSKGITSAQGKRLKSDQVKRMFKRKFYVGILEYNGEYYDGSHQCFISKDLWQKVQKELDRIERPRYKGHQFAFRGLARCGECGAGITAEFHQKIYKFTGRKPTFTYYRCTKKLKPCSQKYLEEKKFGKQIRSQLLEVALPTSWQPDWRSWLEKDTLEEKTKTQENLTRFNLEIENVDKKQNLLLDSFLDGTIESEIYKQKKNELFNLKVKLQDEKAKMETTGAIWLERLGEFIETASGIEKIARAKKNDQGLAILAKRVGSNFTLEDRRLGFVYQQGFAALRLSPLKRRAAGSSEGKTLSVRRQGFEP